ncbi:hypothetical protein V1Y59_15205 [Gordonia sp. PKS22-38]|uniref:Integral membrane protein n=1 Tax=Gordonia prachuapensis TaxID=3115651 RepID=A0ABU7MVS1_9ACTN|nr:hypothetical protein [Gordonia sp. PKS22-38]
MRFRVMLAPPWVQGLINATIFGVIFGLLTWMNGNRPMIAAAGGIIAGIPFGAYLAYRGSDQHRRLTGTLFALDDSGRSEAVSALLHGVVPADRSVAEAAVRLGRAYLGGRSLDNLRKRQRSQMQVMGAVAALGVLAAGLVWDQTGYRNLMIGLIVVIAVILPLDMYWTTSLYRNIEALDQRTRRRTYGSDAPR